jgi:hypothetical protein
MVSDSSTVTMGGTASAVGQVPWEMACSRSTACCCRASSAAVSRSDPVPAPSCQCPCCDIDAGFHPAARAGPAAFNNKRQLYCSKHLDNCGLHALSVEHAGTRGYLCLVITGPATAQRRTCSRGLLWSRSGCYAMLFRRLACQTFEVAPHDK